MPKYHIEIPGMGKFSVDSQIELTDEQAISAAFQQSRTSPSPSALSTPADAPSPYSERVGRRLGEAGEALVDLPKSALGVITGGEKGRVESLLRALEGAGAVTAPILAPVEAAVEQAAERFVSPEAARRVGSVAAIPATLGLGLLAKAGKLGRLGQQIATTLGVGVPKTGAEGVREALRTEPQFRYAASLPREGELTLQPRPSMAPLEELARLPEVTAPELAMAAKSPKTAEALLGRYRAQNDVWLEHAKNEQIVGVIPPEPKFTHKTIIEFQKPKEFDLGLIGTLGTPTSQAARIHPKGGAVAYDMALTEMNLKQSTSARNQRDSQALLGVGDKQLLDAVKFRNVKSYDEILANPGISDDVKRVATHIEEKFKVDRDILLPRLRAITEEPIRKRMLKEEAGKPANLRLSDADFNKAVTTQVEKALPADTSLEALFQKIFPTYYRIYGQTILGAETLIGSANNKLEAQFKIADLVADGVDPKSLRTEAKAIFDSDTLRLFQGRVARHMEAQAKAQGLTPAELEASLRGDFSVSAPHKFFSQFLGQSSRGYTKDLLNVLNFYNRSVEKFMAISDLENRAKPVLKELEGRGYRKLADMLYGSLDHLRGYRGPFGEYFDNTIAGTPVLNKLVAPYAFERWTGALRAGVINGFLRFSPRFHALNATQMAQTLMPLGVSAGDIFSAFKLRRSEAGQALISRHGIREAGTRIEQFGKGLGPAERMNQEVSFLTMYERGRLLGLDDGQAAAYGKLRGNLHSQFIGLVTDVPKAFRSLGPLELSTMFQRFPVKNIELLLDLVKNRQYPGVAKWMATNLLLGGFKAATFSEAGWLTKDLYDKISKDYGKPIADAFHVGLPGFAGVDMSNSVMLYNPPFGEGWAEKVGNLIGGPIGSVLGSITGAISNTAGPEPEAGKRAFNGMVNAIPIGRQIAALGQLLEGDYDFKDPVGRLRWKGEMTDVMKKVLGFRPLKEADLDTFNTALLDVKERRDAVLNYAASRYGQARVAGITLGKPMEDAIKSEVDRWNNLWPDYPITGDAIRERTTARATAATQTLKERMLRGMPAVIRKSQPFQDVPPGGG